MKKLSLLLGTLFLVGCAGGTANNENLSEGSAQQADTPDVELVSEKSVEGYLSCIRQGLGGAIQESPLNRGTRISGGTPAFNIDVYQAIESIYVKAYIPENLQGFNGQAVEALVYRCK